MIEKHEILHVKPLWAVVFGGGWLEEGAGERWYFFFFWGGGAGEKVHTFGCQKAEERIWQLGERVLFLGIKVTQTPCGDL